LAFLAAFSAAFRRVDFLGIIIFFTLTGLADDEGAGGGGAGTAALMIFFFFLGLGKPVILRFRFLREVLEATEAVSNAELHSELESSMGMGMSKAFDRLFFEAATFFFLVSVECVSSRLKIVEFASLEAKGVAASLSEATADSMISFRFCVFLNRLIEVH
jgi:hypothetical protein